MDSDQAIGIARKNGIAKPLATMVVRVEANRAIWMVMDGDGTERGDLTLSIDAATGAIVKKTTQP
jgi:hypothetical protein